MLLGEILSAEVDEKKSPGILKFVPYVRRAGAPRGTDTQENNRQFIHPARSKEPGFECSFKAAVKTLDHAIALRVVCRGMLGTTAKDVVQFTPQTTCELWTLIRCD